jgi:thioredoxin reductase
MRCEPVSLQKLKGKSNVEINYFSNPVEILGDKKVTGIILSREENNKKEEFKLDVDGIFIEIGAAPLIDVVNPIGVSLDAGGFIITDKNCKTNIPGAFAAGDNTNTDFKQMIVAAGEGALAAKSAYNFLKFGK